MTSGCNEHWFYVPARTWIMSALGLLLSPQLATAQLSILSPGNPSQRWHDAQIALVAEQLADPSIQGDLREELQAQLKWLSHWKSGGLTAEPLWVPNPRAKAISEPIVDPENRAAQLRERLLGRNAKPTVRDTESLERLLAESSDDVGIRQLQLHWLDQRQYRAAYSNEIAEVALRVAGMLEALRPQSDEVILARAFCLYRRGRALISQELPESLKRTQIVDPQKHASDLLGTYAQLNALIKPGQPEFVLLDIAMLRRDHWNGKALALLESNGQFVDSRWFLQQRVALLRDLGWDSAREEATQVLAVAFPELAVDSAN